MGVMLKENKIASERAPESTLLNFILCHSSQYFQGCLGFKLRLCQSAGYQSGDCHIYHKRSCGSTLFGTVKQTSTFDYYHFSCRIGRLTNQQCSRYNPRTARYAIKRSWAKRSLSSIQQISRNGIYRSLVFLPLKS
jgi:hypothetical protein